MDCFCIRDVSFVERGDHQASMGSRDTIVQTDWA